MLFQRPPSLAPGWVALAPQAASVHVVCLEHPSGKRPTVRWATTRDWGEPALSLRALRRQYALHRHRTVAVLSRGQYQVLSMDAPEIPAEEWRDAVRWQLPELVDFPVEDAAIDVLSVPPQAAPRRRPSVLVIAAPNEGVAALATASVQAGMPWTAIDIPETGLRNIAALVTPPGRGTALLHVGAHHSTLVVTSEDELILTRSIDVSLQQLTGDDAATRQLAFERTSLELQRTLDNIERQFDQVSLAHLVVAPGAVLDAFMTYVRELVYVPVTALELGQALDMSAVPELTDPVVLAAYLPALGAALRPMGAPTPTVS